MRQNPRINRPTSTGWPAPVWREFYDEGLPDAVDLVVAHEIRRMIDTSDVWPDWVCDILERRAEKLWPREP